MIELASGLGIEVLAEGTETAAEVGMMRSLGCGLYQGYHFGRPLPPEKFLESVLLIESRLDLQCATPSYVRPPKSDHESGMRLVTV